MSWRKCRTLGGENRCNMWILKVIVKDLLMLWQYSRSESMYLNWLIYRVSWEHLIFGRSLSRSVAAGQLRISHLLSFVWLKPSVPVKLSRMFSSKVCVALLVHSMSQGVEFRGVLIKWCLISLMALHKGKKSNLDVTFWALK